MQIGMRLARVVAIAGVFWLATSSLSGSVQPFAYSVIEYPGALATTAMGINAGDAIVGSYRNGTGVHAFKFEDGEFTSFDFPNAAGTEARGIGPSGEIVGTYWFPGEPAVNIHGYRLTLDGTFLPADYPGHINTIPQRILPNGTILGCRHDTDMMGTMRGVVMRPDGTNDETDAFASMHNGATPDGSFIVGLFTNMMTNRVEGYAVDDGEFTPFTIPDSVQTAAWDVNPSREIAGVFRDSSLRFHGFVLRGATYTQLDVPGATATRAFGINAGGDVVGSWIDTSGKTRAFLARRIEQHRD